MESAEALEVGEGARDGAGESVEREVEKIEIGEGAEEVWD